MSPMLTDTGSQGLPRQESEKVEQPGRSLISSNHILGVGFEYHLSVRKGSHVGKLVPDNSNEP